MKNKELPLITIVTVVYNSKELLRKTIASVQNQNYPNIEYILIDGASTDGTLDLIKKNETTFTKVVSERDSGIYNAMNKGIDLSSGAWICFLNAGDVFVDNQSVKKVVDAIIKDPNNSIFYGNILIETSDGEFKERIASEPCNKHRMYFCHQSAFVKTEILSKHKFDENHKMSADFKFFKECFYNKYSFSHINIPIVIFDRSGVSNTNREEGLRDNIAVIKEVDRGIQKYIFLIRLYFVVFSRKITHKK